MSLPNVDAALYTKLSGVGAVTALVSTRIYKLQAPGDSAYPLITYYLASGILPNDNPRDGINFLYRADCWADQEQGAKKAREVADTVFDALHEATLTVTGWSNYWMVVERVTDLVETASGRQFWRRVLDIRIKASKD